MARQVGKEVISLLTIQKILTEKIQKTMIVRKFFLRIIDSTYNLEQLRLNCFHFDRVLDIPFRKYQNIKQYGLLVYLDKLKSCF